MVNGGLTLAGIFQTVGTSCISSDDFMKAHEIKLRRERKEKAQQERNILVARKKVQDKGKEIFDGGPPPRGWVVGDLRAMLRWKMPPDEYKNQKISSANRSTLITLWGHWKDQVTEDIIIHEEEEDTDAIPELHETEVGRAAQRNVQIAMNSVDKLSDDALASMISSLQQIECARTTNATTTTVDGLEEV